MSVLSFHQGAVYFGVLHCIGLTLLLIPPFLSLEYMNLMLGFIFILIGILLQSIHVNYSWLMWLGLIPQDVTYGDYYPLFPWFGIALIGIFLGKFFYLRPRTREWKPRWKKFYLSRGFQYLGQNSLVIYLIHQPLDSHYTLFSGKNNIIIIEYHCLPFRSAFCTVPIPCI